MTEKKEEEKPSNLILKEIAKLQADIEFLKTSTNRDEPEPHHVFDPNCPTCKPKIDAYVKPLVEKGKEDLIKILKERANLPYECVGDGCGVEKGEKECPLCHGTKARKR